MTTPDRLPAKVRARQAAGELLFRAGMSRPRGALAILMYHAVTAEPVRDAMQMSLSASLFASHMAYLRDSNADVVALADGVRSLAQGTGRPRVAVVFDDAFAGVHDHALAALRDYRIPASVFVATDWVGKPAFPDGNPALGRPMTWSELETMAGAGCAIGSHTHSHPVLAALDGARVRDELRRSRDLIATHLGVVPREFAYPYGSYGSFDQHTRGALAEEEFTAACTTVWGGNAPGQDPLALKRLRLSWCDSTHELEKSLAGCYDWYKAVQRVQARS